MRINKHSRWRPIIHAHTHSHTHTDTHTDLCYEDDNDTVFLLSSAELWHQRAEGVGQVGVDLPLHTGNPHHYGDWKHTHRKQTLGGVFLRLRGGGGSRQRRKLRERKQLMNRSKVTAAWGTHWAGFVWRHDVTPEKETHQCHVHSVTGNRKDSFIYYHQITMWNILWYNIISYIIMWHFN